MPVFSKTALIVSLSLASVTLPAEVRFKRCAQFVIPEARQSVAVDRNYFYAVDDRSIAKYRKADGKFVQRWQASRGAAVIHLNSAVVAGARLYAAHSDWPRRPANSSVEVWDAGALKHIQTYRLPNAGAGPLNWLDFHDGYWWGTFAHYGDAGTESKPEGNGTKNTFLAKFDQDWKVMTRWTFPPGLLKRFGAMSNSGGSWGPDGFLYVTGHDLPELYKLKIPNTGSMLEWVETIPLNIRGQGIAWDRHQGNRLYGIIRANDEERKRGQSNKVVVFYFAPSTASGSVCN